MAFEELPSLNPAAAVKQQLVLPSGTKEGSTTGSESGVSTTVGSNIARTSGSAVNMTPEALSALNALIAQLSDRPAVSEADADAQLQAAGLFRPTMKYIEPSVSAGIGAPSSGGVWQYLDEKGRPVDFATWQVAQRRYDSAKQELVQKAGTVQGGTAETKAAGAERKTEIARNRQQQDKYSKEAAFTDATALVSKFSRALAEQVLPQLNRAVEASGTSGNATAALLANDAAARVAEAGASLGLDTAGKYGASWANLSGVLEALTREMNPQTQALLSALQVSKGAVTNTNQTTSGQTTQQVTTEGKKTAVSSETQAGSADLLKALGIKTGGTGGSNEIRISSAADWLAANPGYAIRPDGYVYKMPEGGTIGEITVNPPKGEEAVASANQYWGGYQF